MTIEQEPVATQCRCDRSVTALERWFLEQLHERCDVTGMTRETRSPVVVDHEFARVGWGVPSGSSVSVAIVDRWLGLIPLAVDTHDVDAAVGVDGEWNRADEQRPFSNRRQGRGRSLA